MDIEFIVHDLFALTRPQWKLASNIEEASRAFQLAMAQDQKTSGIDKIIENEDPDSDGASDDGDIEAENETEVDLPEPEVDDDSESDGADVSLANEPYPAFTKSLYKLDTNGDNATSAHGTDSEDEAIIVTREEEQIDPED